ncbi:aryl-alcohol dehydrogenase-like predicted oxidoreductase [Fontibacillus solani]|uniref:Aryl-alcohol dehydrogenase-like predicted oxidoreductase n=1 Tax=Fontibacillus solani TaxID=1572857 RepID=A0A7W3SUE9_9BACL|nr:aryl-alcohol dehydrogenase-like predicted oxidoreductase [Fontibacillus solani]
MKNRTTEKLLLDLLLSWSKSSMHLVELGNFGQDIATETGGNMNQIVLAWMQQKPQRVIPLIAASSSDQLPQKI